MKRWFMAISIIIALTGIGYSAVLLAKPSQKPVVAQIVQEPLSTEEVHYLVNQERAKTGAQPLTRDVRLDKTACERATSIKSSEDVNHNGYDTAIRQYFLKGKIGENLAETNSDVHSVVSGWVSSTTHHANLVDAQFVHVGYCAVTLPFTFMGARNVVIVVQHLSSD